MSFKRSSVARFASILMVLSLLLSACVGAAPSEEPMAAEAGEGELSGEFAYFTWGDWSDPTNGNFGPRFIHLVNKYMELNPGVEINFQPYAIGDWNEVWPWVRQQALAGTLPDVIYAFGRENYWDDALFYNFQEVLQQPNPHSDTGLPWGEEMTSSSGMFVSPIAPGGKVYTVGIPLWGTTNQIAVYYNVDHYEQAGIEKMVPDNYAEWLDQLEKLKAAGFVPFSPVRDGRYHFLGLYATNLAEDLLYGTIDHAIDDLDVGQPDGQVSLKEWAWAYCTGTYTPKTHGSFADSMRLIKGLVPYWPEDWLAPEDVAGSDPWVTQQVSSDWNHGPWAVQTFRADPDFAFPFGTFALPGIGPETSEFGQGLATRALGGSSGGDVRLDMPFMVPASTVENGNLPLVLDFVRWMISPEQIEYWNTSADPRGFDPSVTSYEEAFPDPDMQRQYWGHYNPSTLGIGGGAFWPMLHTQGMSIIDLYYADQLTLEEAIEQVENLWIENARLNILDNPEWDAAGWGCE